MRDLDNDLDIKPIQMQVNDFISKYVPLENRKKFINLMKDWDGSSNVCQAFYDMDVLFVKLKESQEGIIQGKYL